MPPEDSTGAAPAAPAVEIAPAAPAAVPEVAGAAAAAPTTVDSPSPVEAPAADPATPAAEAEKPALTPHTDTPSLLSSTGEKPAEPAKPGDAPAADAPKAADAPAVVAAEPVTFEAFTLPEGVTLAEDQVKTFTDTLVNPELAPQARAQALVDMHVAALQQYADSTAAAQHKAFGDMRAGWRTEVMADAELGGAGHQTAMAAVARMRNLFVPESERAAFNSAMDLTGAGDHPAILRAFYRASRLFDEPAPLRESGRPPPNIGRRPNGAAHGGFYETTGSGPGPTK